jgi:hypothetical protein
VLLRVSIGVLKTEAFVSRLVFGSLDLDLGFGIELLSLVLGLEPKIFGLGI